MARPANRKRTGPVAEIEYGSLRNGKIRKTVSHSGAANMGHSRPATNSKRSSKAETTSHPPASHARGAAATNDTKRKANFANETDQPRPNLKKQKRTPVHIAQPQESPIAPTFPRVIPSLETLPLELHLEILSYSSVRDATRFSQVCRKLDSAVYGSRGYLGRFYGNKERARFQAFIDKAANLRTPEDAESFMEALHFWTSLRGYFADTSSSYKSLWKLMAHLFMGKEELKGQQLEDAVNNWGNLALVFINEHLFRDTPDFDKKTFSHLRQVATLPGMLDHVETQKLIDYLRHLEEQIEEHRLGGQLSNVFSSHFFPTNSSRLTKLLLQPISSVSSADFWSYVHERPGSDGPRAISPPHFVSQTSSLVRLLRLPALPNPVFCYYVDGAWALNELWEFTHELRYGKAWQPPPEESLGRRDWKSSDHLRAANKLRRGEPESVELLYRAALLQATNVFLRLHMVATFDARLIWASFDVKAAQSRTCTYS